MRIKEYTFEHRNDFYAIMECEHCGHEQENKGGYNDSYYHNRVIPEMKCNSCGLSRNDTKEKLGKTIKKLNELRSFL